VVGCFLKREESKIPNEFMHVRLEQKKHTITSYWREREREMDTGKVCFTTAVQMKRKRIKFRACKK
jgi:hypothetical protein